MPEYTASADAAGTLRLLEAIRAAKIGCRFYQASTSEMFGATPPPQNETTTFYPRSPYGAAKLYSHWVTVNYREAYDLFAVSGILFNHESPRRGESFVTRKITLGVAAIKLGVADHLTWATSTRCATGASPRSTSKACGGCCSTTSRRTSCWRPGSAHCARVLRARVRARGSRLGEPRRYNESYERPTEVDALVGDAGKAREVLGWEPDTDAEALARLMVDADLEQMTRLLRG